VNAVSSNVVSFLKAGRQRALTTFGALAIASAPTHTLPSAFGTPRGLVDRSLKTAFASAADTSHSVVAHGYEATRETAMAAFAKAGDRAAQFWVTESGSRPTLTP
jgi:hypothetical protein